VVCDIVPSVQATSYFIRFVGPFTNLPAVWCEASDPNCSRWLDARTARWGRCCVACNTQAAAGGPVAAAWVMTGPILQCTCQTVPPAAARAGGAGVAAKGSRSAPARRSSRVLPRTGAVLAPRVRAAPGRDPANRLRLGSAPSRLRHPRHASTRRTPDYPHSGARGRHPHPVVGRAPRHWAPRTGR
jgi:hypothetical protein